MESPNNCQINSGFTLVELSIVMIIIGLLIGGIFGGMKLVDNANIQKTVQDLKSIDSAGLTFKDIYRGIPGDLKNPSAKLPSCVSVPCNLADSTERGNRRLDSTLVWTDPIDENTERFTFWHQLAAANLIEEKVSPTTSLLFGEGQPESPIDGGYRIMGYITASSIFFLTNINANILLVTGEPSAGGGLNGTYLSIPCHYIRKIDNKMDDGTPQFGRVIARVTTCVTPDSGATAVYDNDTASSTFAYKLSF